MIIHHLNGIDKTQRFPDIYLAAKTEDVISAANKETSLACSHISSLLVKL